MAAVESAINPELDGGEHEAIGAIRSGFGIVSQIRAVGNPYLVFVGRYGKGRVQRREGKLPS